MRSEATTQGTGGSNALYVYVRSGTNFATSTPIVSSSCTCTTEWEDVFFDISQWRGQTIKLRLTGYHEVHVDDVGVMRVEFADWTVNSGIIKRSDGGPNGAYASLGKVPSVVSAASNTMEPLNHVITSSPFAVVGDAQSLTYKVHYPTFTNAGTILYAYVIPTGGSPVKVDTISCHCTTSDWEQRKIDITDWAGQTIQFRIHVWSGSDGQVHVDDIGVIHVDLPNWTVADGLVSRQPGGREAGGDAEYDPGYASLDSGNLSVTSSSVTLPSSVIWLKLDYWFTSAGSNWIKVFILSGTDFSTTTQVRSVSSSSPTGGWVELATDIRAFAGQTVKIRIWRWSASPGPIGIDNVGTNLLEYTQPFTVPDPYSWYLQGVGDPLNLVAIGPSAYVWYMRDFLHGKGWTDCTLDPGCMSDQAAAVGPDATYRGSDLKAAKGAVRCTSFGCRNHARFYAAPFVGDLLYGAASTEHWPGFPDWDTHYVDSFNEGRDDIFWTLWPEEYVKARWWTQKYAAGCIYSGGQPICYDGLVAYMYVDAELPPGGP